MARELLLQILDRYMSQILDGYICQCQGDH